MEINEAHVYPIGRMCIPGHFDAKALEHALQEISVLPRILDYCVENLDAAQLETPYREGGWTIQQVIHHIADSHLNAFVRTKLTLSEETPVIKPYQQDSWVLTADVSDVPVNYSITLLHALHHRWVVLFRSLNEEQMMRCYFHPEYQTKTALWQQVHSYAWHGRHHAEQVRQLRIRQSW